MSTHPRVGSLTHFLSLFACLWVLVGSICVARSDVRYRSIFPGQSLPGVDFDGDGTVELMASFNEHCACQFAPRERRSLPVGRSFKAGSGLVRLRGGTGLQHVQAEERHASQNAKPGKKTTGLVLLLGGSSGCRGDLGEDLLLAPGGLGLSAAHERLTELQPLFVALLADGDFLAERILCLAMHGGELRLGRSVLRFAGHRQRREGWAEADQERAGAQKPDREAVESSV